MLCPQQVTITCANSVCVMTEVCGHTLRTELLEFKPLRLQLHSSQEQLHIIYK